MIGVLKSHWVLGGAERYLADLGSVLGDYDEVRYISLTVRPDERVCAGVFRDQVPMFEVWPFDPAAIAQRSCSYGLLVNGVSQLASRFASSRAWCTVFSPGPPVDAAKDRIRRGAGLAMRGTLNRLPSGLGARWLGADRVGMFPYRAPRSRMRSYERVLSISEFVSAGIREYWGMPADLVYPCVDDHWADAPYVKKRQVVSVGRFLPSGNHKHHAVLIDAFRLLVERDSRYQLVLVGGFEGSSVESAYVEELRRRCEGLPVKIVVNATEKEKVQLLGESAAYWHSAGYASPLGDYGTVEQFGIAIVEGMLARAVPFVFPRGGVTEVVPDSRYGRYWQSPEELANATYESGLDPQVLPEISSAARARAMAEYSRERLRERVSALYCAGGAT